MELCSLPVIYPGQIMVEVIKIMVASFKRSTNALPKEHPGLISFRMDWLDLLAVQGTLKSLLQYHSSKASILQNSVFFTV